MLEELAGFIDSHYLTDQNFFFHHHNNSMDSSNLSSTQKAEIMDTVKEQIAVATAQELLSKLTNKCFSKCVSKPGTSLDSSEQKCLNFCVDRFFDSYNIVSMAYGSRVQRESHMG